MRWHMGGEARRRISPLHQKIGAVQGVRSTSGGLEPPGPHQELASSPGAAGLWDPRLPAAGRGRSAGSPGQGHWDVLGHQTEPRPGPAAELLSCSGTVPAAVPSAPRGHHSIPWPSATRAFTRGPLGAPAGHTTSHMPL